MNLNVRTSKSVFLVVMTLILSACGQVPSASGPAQSDRDEDVTELGAQVELSDLKVLENEITVSGLSAGAFMATQLQVAYSSRFAGVGSIAGGPWDCAGGFVADALRQCMEQPNRIDVARSILKVREAAALGAIDPTDNLKKARVYLFNSPRDTVVKEPMNDRVLAFYQAFVPATQIKNEHSVLSEHGMPTLEYGAPCEELKAPFINRCGFDGAGQILTQLYPAKSLARGQFEKANLHVFDQSKFGSGGINFDQRGYVYVPKACETKACAVHMALHGCSQASETIKKVFVVNAGYNEWADASEIIVLYPQVKASWDNPKGCFDWFGYTGANYATRDGLQMKALMSMIDSFQH